MGSPASRQWLGGGSDGRGSDPDTRIHDTASLDPLAVLDYVPPQIKRAGAHRRAPPDREEP